jgi:DNA-binding CsgD family transcriptional regulator
MRSLDTLFLQREECLQEIEWQRMRLRAISAEISQARRARVPAKILTPRQRQVLDMIAANMENKEIAGALHMSVRTAKFHVSNLLQKFGVTSRKVLVTIARAA